MDGLTATGIDWTRAEDEALELFRALIRIPTVNPPGNERPAAELVADTLRAAGLEPELLEGSPDRTNVVTRLKGDGSKPPLLLNAHLDVVAVEEEHWKHPPFNAEIHDGYVWGRGAVDMKNMAAMSTIVMKLLKQEGVQLKRDVIFAAIADEENGCLHGSEYLVAHHPEKVRAEYALGEIGGFSLHINGVTYYPVQIAHKGVVWGRMRAKGEPGHGSLPREDTAIEKLSQAVHKLSTTPLPRHECQPVREMIHALAAAQKFPSSAVLKGIANPVLSPHLVKLLPKPSLQRVFKALMANTAIPTVLRAGEKTNVIPGEASAEFDGRTLPGQTTDDLVREVQQIVGPDIDIEVFDEGEPVQVPADTELFHALAQAVLRADPNGIVIPYVMPGYTDARAYQKLGIKHYGFSPLRFDVKDDIAFADLYHGHNERAPVDGFKWGLRLLYDAVKSFCS